jgi:hypothetical protein
MKVGLALVLRLWPITYIPNISNTTPRHCARGRPCQLRYSGSYRFIHPRALSEPDALAVALDVDIKLDLAHRTWRTPYYPVLSCISSLSSFRNDMTTLF